MNIEKMFYADAVEETHSAKPMALAVMKMVLPDVAIRIMNRRFGMDGKTPLSTEQVASRYGLPVGVVNAVLFASMNTISDMGQIGLDTTP